VSENSSLISTNRKAKFSYFLEDKYEAGIILKGTEVKAIREKKISIEDSYAILKGQDLYAVGIYIGEYKQAGKSAHEPNRIRKLLLHKDELKKLYGKIKLKGYSIVLQSMYFNKKNIVKVSIFLAKGKKLHDKRQALKEREWERRKKQVLC
jgi:SsrA-binding protein